MHPSNGIILRHYPLDIGFGGPEPPKRKAPMSGKYGGEGQFLALLSTLTSGAVVPNGTCDANLYLLPFSCSAIHNQVKERHLGQYLTERFTKSYLDVVKKQYPCFNKRRGADHFFVCCHDMGWTAIQSAAAEDLDVSNNVIWVGYSADLSNKPGQRFVYGRDVSLPLLAIDQETKNPFAKLKNLMFKSSFDPLVPRNGPLAFFAGTLLNDGPTRARILKLGWATSKKDAKWKTLDWPTLVHTAERSTTGKDMHAMRSMLVLDGHIDSASYDRFFTTSKFCLAPRGMRVWSPRLGEAFEKGCVPVILANGYSLPLNEDFDWREFSVIHDDTLPGLTSLPLRLLGIWKNKSYYDSLRRRLFEVREHFLWPNPRPKKDFDLWKGASSAGPPIKHDIKDDATGLVLRKLFKRSVSLMTLPEL